MLVKTMSQTVPPNAPKVPVPQPGIADLAPYVPGKAPIAKDSAQEIFKLSSNESALGPSPKAMAAFEAATGDLHLYPDGSAAGLREAIGNEYGLNPDHLICGAGSDEILQLLCQAYLGVGDNIVQSAHGFLVYAIAAQACGAQVRFAEETDLTADIDAMLALIDERTKIIFLANPNNPTGTWLSKDQIAQLHANLPPHVLLVLDAAYAEYMTNDAYEPGIDLVSRNRNVVMTRTFSKIYGLGALRLGWAYGPPGIIDILNRVRGPFNVSAPAQLAGIAAVGDHEFVEKNRQHNEHERAVMTQRLRGLGLRVQDSAGNFLLVHFEQVPGRAASDMQAYLAKEGVMVREMTAYGLPDALRISIGESKANHRCLDLLDARLGENGNG